MIIEMTDQTKAIEAKIPHSENYLFFEWLDGVYFTAAMLGEAMTIHIAAERNSIGKLRDAANEFCEYLFNRFKWCKMILGIIKPQSVVNLSLKCGFGIVGFAGEHTVVARLRA